LREERGRAAAYDRSYNLKISERLPALGNEVVYFGDQFFEVVFRNGPVFFNALHRIPLILVL